MNAEAVRAKVLEDARAEAAKLTGKRRANAMSRVRRLSRITPDAYADVMTDQARRAYDLMLKGVRAPEPRPDCPRPDKNAWLTKGGARDEVRYLHRRGGPGIRWVSAYKCRCQAWHAGDYRKKPKTTAATEAAA